MSTPLPPTSLVTTPASRLTASSVTCSSGGSNVVYGGGGATDPTSRTTVAAEDTIEANDIRKVTAQLRGDNVPTFNGLYMGYIHPDVSYDLRSETGAAAWRDPHVYVDTDMIYNGEIGAFEGVRFIETPRAKVFEDASDGSGSPATSTCTARTSWAVRLSPRHTQSPMATARFRASSVALWLTPWSVSSRSAGTGSVATAGSARLRFAGSSRRPRSARTADPSSLRRWPPASAGGFRRCRVRLGGTLGGVHREQI
jgi:hypothetical protein